MPFIKDKEDKNLRNINSGRNILSIELNQNTSLDY